MTYDDKFIEAFSEYFTKLRKDRKMSRRVVADFMGLPEPTYTCYEKGTRGCPLSVLKKLCLFYNIDYIETMVMLDKEASKREREIHH